MAKSKTPRETPSTVLGKEHGYVLAGMDTDRDEPVVVTAVDGGLAVVSTAYAEAGVCFFESSEDAHHALDRLLSTGLPPNFDIEVLEMDPGLVWGTA